MCALFNDFAVTHDENQGGIADGGQAMRNNKARPAFHERIKCLLYE